MPWQEDRKSISSTENPSTEIIVAPLSSIRDASTATELLSQGIKDMVRTHSSQGNITTADLRSIAFMASVPPQSVTISQMGGNFVVWGSTRRRRKVELFNRMIEGRL